ncbi:MAG: hypothetical protein QOG21_1147, partial [Actinomycetota bacterium]|nr:hypothetical protein [Actinomycetota bacterium]
PEPARSSPEASTAAPRLISGGRAIGAFIVLAAVLAGILLFTRRDHQTTPPVTNHAQSAVLSLTNAEAKAKFKELNQLRIRAYVQRDLTLVPLVAVPGSRAARTATREIRRLRADSVIPRPNFLTKRLTVANNSASKVQIRQVLHYDLRFVDEDGNDVTGRDRPQRQVILWTLRKSESGDWLISDGVITASRPVEAR